MKTFTFFFVVCLGMGMTNAGGVPLDIGKALKQVGTYMFGRVTGIDLSNFGGIQDKYSQLKSNGDRESYLGELAAAFVAKVKDSPFLQDKSVSDIMSTYKDNIRSFLTNGIPNSSPSWQAGLDNEVLGLNKTEYQKLMGTHPEPTERRSENVGSARSKRQTASLPKSVDWRTKGAVTPVKNQAKCGSCWAFATIGALEGRLGVKTGSAPVLSEQNLVDCAKNVNGSKCCQGCDGGFMTDGYAYVQLNDGIDSDSSYPYEAVDGECRYDASGKEGSSVGYEYTKEDDEKDLMRAVAEGPVAVAVDANEWSTYKGGVFKCHNIITKLIKSVKINHGVTIVGYGTDRLWGDYWIVKNSWGDSWGEKGYIRIARNSGNQCGIASQANYPLV